MKRADLGIEVDTSLHGFRRRGCGHSNSATLAYEVLNRLDLFRLEVTELILDIQAMLAAQVEQILALHVQLARQGINSQFLFLQALLPYTRGNYRLHHLLPIHCN
jgi:hypothetical protein